MKRRELIKCLSVLPLSAVNFGFDESFASGPAYGANKKIDSATPKRIAAIVTEYRLNSHTDVIVGKYLEGFNHDQMPPYPESKIVSLFTEQVPANDMSREMAGKYNVPIFRTVAEALTLGGDDLAVDGILLIGEHGTYPTNDKGQKLYPRFEMFLKITDVFRQYNKSVPVFNDKHLSYSFRQAQRMVDISRELKFPMLAGSTAPVTWRIPAVDTPYGAAQKYAVAISYSGLDVYGFHLLDNLQAMVERRKGGETGVRSVQCLEDQDCWQFMESNEWVERLFKEALSRSDTPKKDDPKELVKNPAVFVIEYNDGLKAAAFLMTGLVEDFTVAVELDSPSKTISTLMRMQGQKPYYHFGCLVKNIEIMFNTGKAPYPVERTMLSSGILDFALESRFRGYKKLETAELAKVHYQASPESHFFTKGWDSNGKRLD